MFEYYNGLGTSQPLYLSSIHMWNCEYDLNIFTVMVS